MTTGIVTETGGIEIETGIVEEVVDEPQTEVMVLQVVEVGQGVQ